MKPKAAFKDRYGFWFWLKWIIWFAGSFVISAASWTFLMKKLFHEISGPELEMTWCISVFGTWFLLVIPFMRKKEQIWKRLNEDQEKSVNLWFLGAGIFIALLIAACFFWSYVMRDSIKETGFAQGWVKNVFGVWLACLVPLFIYMYRQADHIFRRAHLRQTYTPNYRQFYLEPQKRQLPKNIAEKLKKIPETLPRAHVVDIILKNAEIIPGVFIKFRREIAGVYDREVPGFDASEIAEIKPVEPERLAHYEESRWLRVDIPDDTGIQ